MYSLNLNTTKQPKYTPKYSLKPDGSFVIENYNFAKPFANFFPGIAGQYGIPIWAFYVNRGQCISSFGTKNKDNALLEFFPANKAWQLTPSFGFRSFLKVINTESIFYEPFHNGYFGQNFQLHNTMSITPFDLTLKEENHTLGLTIEINYFPIPNECFAALARTIKIKNISRKKLKIQLLDGLPLIVPMGINNVLLKELGRTAEAWMKTKYAGDSAAFYKLDVDPCDRPEVIYIQKGNFCVSFSKLIIDPSTIFGPRLNLDYPYHFLKERNFKYPKNQSSESKTPSGMGMANFRLLPDEAQSFTSLFGNIRSHKLLKSLLTRIKSKRYLPVKREQNKEIIKNIQSDIYTQSACAEFNLYCQQTYLDNIIRGGYPVIFESQKGKKQVFYLYLRKHGDLERDYNKFQIQRRYFSQGNGNFRDVVQNRRNDVWFNPDIEAANLITFFNLIQTDGFNPLIVKGLQFHLKNKDEFRKMLPAFVNKKDIKRLIAFLSRRFTPGNIIFFIEENKLSLKKSKEELLNLIMVNSLKEEDAQHKPDEDHHGAGFWTDHWTYCLDLLESYLELYPERLKELVFEKRVFKFFDSIFVVSPRSEKYVIYEGKIRQLNSVKLDAAKLRMQNQRPSQAHLTRVEYGRGKIYQTTLIAKLICIILNKLTSLDPFGCGIEMEANKPNWYDALNGLPALFGSSTCETIELKRLIIFVKQALQEQAVKNVTLFKDLANFLNRTFELLNSETSAFAFWDKSYTLKEEYRKKTLTGISSQESKIDTSYLLRFFDKALKKLEAGLKKTFNTRENLYSTYFINQVSKSEIKNGIIYPRKFTQKKLPLFLEAQVHALKIEKKHSARHRLYCAIKKSQLYDKKLKMYKVAGRLSDMPFEIGRCRAFSRGWLENESIWLHMEYKYLLEILRAGLYEEFYSDFRNILICFQDPERYGRSILENSSFIVSSAFPDKSLIGTGFVARLSGSTAEFLHIWRIMNVGQKPFFLNNKGELNLRFNPVLASWLFKKDKTYSFNFLGSTNHALSAAAKSSSSPKKSGIRIIYHNPKNKNTFGKNAVSVQKILFKDKDGSGVKIASEIIPHPFAEQIRSRQISQIEIFLA
ncbi:MAG: hypothetical protein ABIC18_04755 [Candidatus Omnitrophota bacterium]